MKKIAVVLCLLILASTPSGAHYGSRGGVSFGIFYSSLEPHGEWISLDYGVYAWRPFNVSVGWRPYTVGRWMWTDDGWYWFSDEPWGWAAYHYGRWYYDDFYGWIWIPGYHWAPAWVEWRYGGDYIGWAPLGPYAVFSISIGIHYGRHWVTPHHYWSFVHCNHVTAPHIYRHVYRADDNRRYIGRTRTVGNIRYEGGRVVSRGPEREYIERRGKVKVERYEMADVDELGRAGIVRHGGTERIEAYRPRIERAPDATSDRPGRVRESDKRVSLETDKIDVRSRERERGIKEDVRAGQAERERPAVRRESERRPGTDIQREQGDARRPEPSVRQERNVERREKPSPREVKPPRYEERKQVERKSESVDRQRSERREAPARQESMQKRSNGSSGQERSIQRPEPRKEQRSSGSSLKQDRRRK